MSSKIKIFVVAHKPCDLLEGNTLVPIHVGRAVSPFGKEMVHMIGDDTGANISEKNPSLCEMTAHYWVWKNVKDVDYVGICHYRRYFGSEINNETIDGMMADTDVLMVEPSYYIDSVYSYFAKYTGAENMAILSMVMKDMFPDFFVTLEKVCDGIKFHPFNMLICKKGLFDEYCEWIFGILRECEKYIKPSPYYNAGRALAYMAELLTGVFYIHRQMKIKSVPYFKVEDGRKVLVTLSEEKKRKYGVLESLLQNEMAEIVSDNRREKFDNPAIILGLKNDGIKIS